LIAPGDGDPRAFGHEQLCGRKTDAAVAACNQRRFVREPHDNLLSTWLKGEWLHY
jgi:hypothetical protein